MFLAAEPYLSQLEQLETCPPGPASHAADAGAGVLGHSDTQEISIQKSVRGGLRNMSGAQLQTQILNHLNRQRGFRVSLACRGFELPKRDQPGTALGIWFSSNVP